MKRYRTLLTASLSAFGLSALSLSAIPIASHQQKNALSYVIAGVFWVGMLAGLILAKTAHTGFRRQRHRLYKLEQSRPQQFSGAFTFRITPVGMALYLITAAGLILMISDMIAPWLPEQVLFPVLSATMFAFVLHCFLDGKNYQAYKRIKEGMKNGQEHETAFH